MTEPVQRARDRLSRLAIVALLASSVAFAAIAVMVADHDPILQRDLQVLVWLHTHGNAVFTAFLLAVSDLHSLAGIAAISAILAIALARRHKWYWVLSLVLAIGGGMLLNMAIKLSFHRLRPVWNDPILTLTTPSFPSGHTAAATLFYGFLAAYLVSHVSGTLARVAVVVACVAMVALVAFSRMYLGVHYPSDVLAAMSASSAWLVLCLGGVRILSMHRVRLVPWPISR